MNPRIEEIFSRLQQLEGELEQEIEKARSLHGFSVSGGRIAFEESVKRHHLQLRLGLREFFKNVSLLKLIVAPVIYSMIVPIALLDIWITLYQQIYFRVYRIARVNRAEYIVFDRQHLRYLNKIEALNCVYCGYGNGVIAYAREIASRTEQYWCPIKHALHVRDPHQRYFQFAEYGDADSYRAKLAELREKLQG